MTAGRAWAILGALVATYELAADDEQLLTRGVQRAMSKHPAVKVGVLAGVGTTALHLVGALPAWADPYGLLHLVRAR